MITGVSYTTRPLAVFTRIEEENPVISKARSHSFNGALPTSPFCKLYHTWSALPGEVETVTGV